MYVRSAQDGERPEIYQVDDPALEEEAAMRRVGPAAMGDDGVDEASEEGGEERAFWGFRKKIGESWLAALNLTGCPELKST